MSCAQVSERKRICCCRNWNTTYTTNPSLESTCVSKKNQNRVHMGTPESSLPRFLNRATLYIRLDDCKHLRGLSPPPSPKCFHEMLLVSSERWDFALDPDSALVLVSTWFVKSAEICGQLLLRRQRIFMNKICAPWQGFRFFSTLNSRNPATKCGQPHPFLAKQLCKDKASQMTKMRRFPFNSTCCRLVVFTGNASRKPEKKRHAPTRQWSAVNTQDNPKMVSTVEASDSQHRSPMHPWCFEDNNDRWSTYHYEYPF